MTDNNSLIQDWFRFAMTDYETAKHLINTMHPKPLEIICYHCQQSAEKFCKGFLVSHNIEPPKTHDLPLLCKMCIEKLDTFQELYDICELLNPYGTQPRYPNEIEILEIDAEKAIENTQAMIAFFENQGIKVKP